MDAETVDVQYFTYDGRLASFQKSKKRGSTAKGSKALNWPHKKIVPEDLARAGFFFQPWPDNPDNCVCFLCHKNIDGWEEGDDPLMEHLKHSAGCGWAITAAVDAELEGYEQVHPGEATMVEARKATFAGRWPHDGKRGWTCKTKQLADAGWKYTPTPDSDDNATCAYCGLGLDGWEPKDKPYDEHHKRSPECPFFILSSQPNPSKKAGKGKAARASKASRLSTQSTATLASEAPSVADTTIATTAAGDDTVLTTTSTMTQGAKKGRAKKGTTAKGRKTRAKKEEPAEPVELEELEEVPAPEVQEASPVAPLPKGRKTKAKKGEPTEPVEPEEALAPEAHETSPVALPKRATRGKKRGSDAVDESTMTTMSEAPARKKRVTRNKGSVAVESSVVEPAADEEMPDAPAPVPAPKKTTGRKKQPAKKRGSAAVDSSAVEPTSDEEMADIPAPKKTPGGKKGRGSTARTTRKVSARSNVSMSSVASFHTLPDEFPDDDEIERQLEADLERPLTDDEDITVDSDSERNKVKAKTAKGKKVAQEKKSEDYAMLDPSPAEPDDNDVEDELKALRAQMEIAEPEKAPEPEPEPEQLQVPKKGRKAGTRKTSKQTKTKKAKAVEPPPEEDIAPAEPEPVPEPVPEPEPELEDVLDEQDASMGSTDTVVKKSEPGPATAQGRGRGGLFRASFASQSPTEADELAEDPVEPEPVKTTELPKKRGRGQPSKASGASVGSVQLAEKPVEPVEPEIVEATEPPKKRGRGRPSKASGTSIESVQLAEKPVEPVEPPKKRGPGRPKASQGSGSAAAVQAKLADAPVKRGRGRPPKKPSVESKSEEANAQLQEEAFAADSKAQAETAAPASEPEIFEEKPGLSPVKESPVAPSSASRQLGLPSFTPVQGVSPSASARQAALSPSQSPQPSDAENKPPSSKPPATATTKRVALAPIAATPARASPKRNMLAGLQSKTPWKQLDLDLVLGTPFAGDKENATESLLRKGKELTSPEKQMTVEEWIYFNAGEAEKMLKHECETMVSRFETEAAKAMNVLEGLVVEE